MDGGASVDRVLKQWRQAKISMYAAHGCAECDGTGYKGRLAVYELVVADAAVKRLIQGRSPVTDIAEAAIASGMRTLKQDAIDKVLKGYTDMQQARTV